MPSVEISKLQGIGAVRALSDNDRAQPGQRPASSAPAATRPGITVEIGTSAAGDLVSPPVDPERVEKIRIALRDGTYPLVPTMISDAMIAAQVSFAVVPRAAD
jgi:negative regulator of flagellin synthesis FlgM